MAACHPVTRGQCCRRLTRAISNGMLSLKLPPPSSSPSAGGGAAAPFLNEAVLNHLATTSGICRPPPLGAAAARSVAAVSTISTSAAEGAGAWLPGGSGRQCAGSAEEAASAKALVSGACGGGGAAEPAGCCWSSADSAGRMPRAAGRELEGTPPSRSFEEVDLRVGGRQVSTPGTLPPSRKLTRCSSGGRGAAVPPGDAGGCGAGLPALLFPPPPLLASVLASAAGELCSDTTCTVKNALSIHLLYKSEL